MYIFIEEQDFDRRKIVNDDVIFRIHRLVDDTLQLVDAFNMIRKAKDEEYDF